MLGYQDEGPDCGQIAEGLSSRICTVGSAQHSRHVDRGVADRHDRIKGGDLCGEAVEIDELIDVGVVDHAAAREPLQQFEIALDVAILQRNEICRCPAEQWRPVLQIGENFLLIAAPP